jgi:hypothetical protein
MDDFDQFWSVYPRRVAKEAARRMYAKALKLTTSAEILHAAKRYAEERQGQDKQFTKHPATWLNAGCWGDYAATPETAAVAQQMNGLVYVPFADPALDAWVRWELVTRKSRHRDKSGGAWFPTRWPPGHQEQAA